MRGNKFLSIVLNTAAHWLTLMPAATSTTSRWSSGETKLPPRRARHTCTSLPLDDIPSDQSGGARWRARLSRSVGLPARPPEGQNISPWVLAGSALELPDTTHHVDESFRTAIVRRVGDTEPPI